METDLTIQLTIEEKADLENLEGAIKRELGSFIVVGQALEEIRAKRLYREGYKNFKDYCDEKWQMGRAHAARMIAGSRVVANLSPHGDLCTPCEIMPTSEYQIRPLVQLEPEQQRTVWKEAVRSADGKVVTNKQVKDAVTELIGPGPGAETAFCFSLGARPFRAPAANTFSPTGLNSLGAPLPWPWRGCGGPESS